jgi:hypothetical protein
MRKFTFSLALAILLMPALAAPAAAVEERPFSARFSGAGVPAEQRCGPNALTLGFAFTGTSTHLGRLTGGGTNCTEFGLATQGVAIWDGEVTITAADGSTLSTVYAGSQDAPVGGVASSSHMHTVVGGTGRFEGATGVWLVTTTLNFADFSTSGRVTGWLAY